MKAAENLENQPIWVQDLVAWLDKIEQQGEEWSERVKEVLAELPGQGLPEEFWPAGENGEEETETEAERQLLSDENRIRIQQALQNAQAIEDEWYRSGELVAVATQIPASEPQLLEKALHAAEKIQDERYRLEVLAEVAARLPASEPQLLQKALHAAEKIESEGYRSRALAAVAARLPASEPQLLQKVLHAAEKIESEGYRSQPLAAVAAQIPANERQVVLQKALHAAEKIESEGYRSRALAAVANQIPTSEPQLLEKVLHAAEKLNHEEDRWQPLAAVATQIPANERQVVLQKALHAAEKIEHEERRLEALAAVNAQIPANEPQLLEKVLHAAEKIESEWYRLDALTLVAAQIPASEPQLLEKVLHAAEQIEDDWYRFGTLVTVAIQLPASERHVVLQKTLHAAENIKHEERRLKALALVAEQLPTSEFQVVLEKTLQVVEKIENDWDRLEALAAVAAQIPSSERHVVLQKALQTAEKLEYVVFSPQVLEAFAAQIPASEPQLLQKALQTAEKIEHEHTRLGVLRVVAAQIPASEPQLLEKALHAAEKIQDEQYRSYALVWVAAQLPASEPQLLQKALHAAEKIEDDSDRSMALAAVAAQIPPSERHVVLQKALHAAENIKHEERRLYALVWVAAQLPASERHVVLQKALQTAEKIEHDSDRSRALAEVAAQIPPSERHVVLQKALHAAEKIEHEEYQDRSAALAAVAAQIPDSDLQLLEKALHAAEKIEHEEYRSMALKAVSAQIPASKPQLLEKALQTAEKIEHEWSRLRVLEAVAAQIPDSDLQLLEKALHAAEKIEHEEYRSMALKAVSAQIPASKPQLLQQAIQLSLKFKDKQYRIETLRTIAFKFLESLLLHCPADKFSTLLEIVPQGENSSDKAKFLSALASQLSSGLFPRALQLIQTEISHPVYQAESLCNLAPYLPREQFSEALNLVQYHIPGFSYPTTALCGLIPHLSLTELEQALTIAEQRCTHPDLLRKILHQAARCLSHLPERQTEAVRSDLRDDLIDWILDRAQQQLATDSAMTAILTALIPGLTSDAHLKLIKNTILPKLASEFYRAEVLAALARSPHLTPEQLAQFRPLAERLQQDRPKATALSAFIPIAPELHQTVVDLWNNAPNSIRDDDLAFILTTRPHPRPQDQQALNQLKSDQSRALRLIRGLSGEVDRADYLIQLAPHLLQEQTLEVEAQSIAQELQDPYHRTRSLLALAAPFPDVRPEAERQIEQLKTEQFKDEESDDEESKYNYLIQHIELLSQFATIVPEQIPVLLKAIEKWAKENPFDDEGDQRTYKRRRILIALRPHLPIRLVREIDRQTGIGQAPQDLWQRALFVLRTEYRQALKTGSLRNDAKQAEDLLNLKAEIDALTDMLMMRDLEPPVAVGILGGWGSGKSYIMHLMQTRTIEIRSQALEPIEAWGLKPTEGEAAPQSQSPEQSQPAVEGETAEQSQPAAEDKTAENSKHLEQDQPAAKDKTAETSQMPDDDRVSRYVGHIYQIKFDAWTYAKANLWASLMQTIFVELDRQITLETHLREVLGTVEENQRKTIENEIWPVLYQSKDNEREWFLKNVLKDRDLIDTLKDKQSQADRSGILWKKFQESRDMANRELKATETALQLKRQQREDRKRALQTNIRRDFAPILDLTQTPSFQTIEALLGTSFSLLKRRIGRTASESLSEEILQQLFGQRSPDRNGKTGSNDSRRLWQKLEDTLNQHLGKRSADNQGKTAANDSRGLWQKLEDTLNQLDEARKKLEAAEQNTAEAAQETAAAGDSPENTSGQPSEKELEAAEQDTAEAVQKTAAVVDSPKNTPEQPSDKKEAVQKSVQNVAQIKFDLFNVAARTIEAKQALLDRHRNWNWIQKNWLLVALFLLLFVLPLGGLAWLGFNLFFSAKVTITQLAAKLATLIAPLLPGVAILQTLFRSGQKWFEETRLALHEVGKSVEHRNQELATTYERTVQERLQTDGRLQTLDQEIQALEREYDRQKQVVPINQYATLSGFIRDRLEQGTYNNQLGLMQQVKQDLADLSDKLLPPRQNDRSFHSHLADLPKMFPRGPARVVVYIDDLDRCPPDTVVEVLEAVQLLVKNPLFIAVLAIDERYINRALAKHYQGVLSLQGRPSAADYLEKIIQIPYRVRPIDEEALHNYLKAQTVVQDSETSGTKFNEFSPREFDLLVDCCQEAELSPRSLKRLTNVYKLYKVLSRTRGQRPTPREQKAILTLLAFSSRYPDLMRDILQTIGSHYEEGQHLAEEELTLAGVFHHYLANDARHQSHNYLAQDVEKLKHDVRKLVAKDLKLSEIKGIFDFVRTFSFVGDIGVDIAPSTHGSQVAPKSFA